MARATRSPSKPTNRHYLSLLSRVQHANLSAVSDDVTPTGGADQSGYLSDPDPSVLTVTVGGPSSSATTVELRDITTRAAQRPGGGRDSGWTSADEDEKQMLARSDASTDGGDEEYNSTEPDPEKGIGRGKQTDPDSVGAAGKRDAQQDAGALSLSVMTRSLTSPAPRAWAGTVTSLLQRLEASSPVHAKRRLLVELVVRLTALFLNLSVHALASRATVALFLVLFYLCRADDTERACCWCVSSGRKGYSVIGVDLVNFTQVTAS